MKISDKINPKPDASQQRPPFDGKWRFTETIGCPAAPLHIALGCERQDFDAHTLALFYEGILHEFDLKKRMREAGYWITDFPDGVELDGYPVVTHSDGIHLPQPPDYPDGEVVETKSVVGLSDAEKFVDEHPQYVKQVNGYMMAHGLKKTRVVVKDRGNGWVDDIVIDFDQAVLDPILKNIQVVDAMVKSGQTVCTGPWAPGCSRDFMTRLFCPFNSVHCKGDAATATVELEKLLVEYAPRKVLADITQAEVDMLREQIGAVMKGAGMERTKSLDGISASYLPDRRKYVNSKLLQEKFPDVYKAVQQESGSSILRVTIPAAIKRAIGVEVMDVEEDAV